ncbi:MAG TPA: zinc-ribbon domain containing protein [Pantanalinema sp.]
MQDKMITCRDCSGQFTFTVGEQEFYAQKGYTNDPQRCPSCRSARKAATGGTSMGARPQRELFPAQCGECGVDTKVPFRPTQGKPVFCSDCYRKMAPAR